MNSNMAKEASANRIISKSVKELTKNLSNSGVKLKGGVDSAVKQVTKTDFGLAGMLGGAAKGGAKAVGKQVNKVLPQNAKNQVQKALDKTKPVAESMSKARKKFDTAIADIDMKGGAIGYKYAPGKSKELFVQKKRFEIEPGMSPGNKTYLEHEINSMSEPLKKARNVAVPIAGGMYISDKLENLKYNPANEVNNQKKTAQSREEVIDKVAHLIQNDSRAYSYMQKNANTQIYLEKMTKLASDASVMLKQASESQTLMMEKIASLEKENETLKAEIYSKVKDYRSVRLANEMLDKGIIKKAEYSSKKEEIYNMDDQAFNILKNIVDNINIQKVASEDLGISSLMYIAGESTQKEKKTMLDSFLE